MLESVKKIYCVPEIYLLPVELLMFTSKKSIVLVLLSYILCIYMLRDMKKRDAQMKMHPVMILLAIMISAILGFRFYKRWKVSYVLAGLLGHIGILNQILFCIFISSSLTALAIWGLSNLVCLYCTFVKLNNGKYDAPSVPINNGKMVINDFFIALGMALFVGFFIGFRPLSNFTLGIDESVFMYIGKQMKNGLIPYRDLFDHKGILLYFFNYFGFLISGDSYWGIWLICILNAFAFALIQLKILKMLTDNKAIIIITEFVITVMFGTQLDCSVNMAEGYALPWISLVLYICLKYIEEKSYRNYEIVLIGISFAVIFFLRCNMIGVFIFIPIILIMMIIQKKGNEILKCTAAFVLGALLVLVPLFVYFIKTDSLSYVIKYYFEFNYKYTAYEASITSIMNTMVSLTKILKIAIILLLSFPIFRKNRVYIANLIAWVASLVLASISGKAYPHYAVIMLPMCAVLLCYFFQPMISSIPYKLGNLAIHQLIYVGIIILSVFAILSRKPITATSYANADSIDEYILTNTSEKDDVLIIGNEVFHYLYTGRNTLNKFFYQTPPINISEEIYQDFLYEFDNNKSNCVIFTEAEKQEDDSNMSRFCKYMKSLEIYEQYDYEGFSVFWLK